MDHPEGAGSQRGDRVDFDRRVRLEFRGTQLSSDGGLLVMRELDDALGLSDLASAAVFVKVVVRRFHAASLISEALVSRSGFSQTGPAGCQLRVFPDHRSGFCARAFA